MSKTAPISNHKPRVVILANRPADLKSAVGYLQRRDYDVSVSRSLNDAIESVAAGTCEYLLLSIDLPHSRAEILPQVLEQTFNVAVIVFSEKQDRRTTQRLGSLKARNILFSQPSGPSILARIRQVWVPPPAEREAKRRLEQDAKAYTEGEKFLAPKEVAAQLLELLNRTLIQQGKAAEHAPEEKPPQAFEFSQAPAVVTRHRKRRAAKKLELDDYGNPIARPAAFETKTHEVVWDTVDASLQDVCPTDSKLSYLMGPITEAELMCIDSMNFKGTFVVAYSGDEDSADASPLVAMEAKLIKDLKARGFHIREQDVTVLPMFDFDIPAKLLNAAELVVTHSCRQFDVSFAYYSSTRLIPMFDQGAPEEPMLTIDIGQFVPGSTVNVDIFLPMPLNKKFVRYWRRGSEVTEEQLTKVASHGAVQLSVRKDQAELFNQYCAYQAIKAEVARIEALRSQKKKAA